MTLGSPGDAHEAPRGDACANLRPKVAARLAVGVVDRDTVRVVQAFAEAGVPTIVLKGPSTREFLAVADRVSADIDLLVPPSGLKAAAQALRTLGYELGGSATHSDTWRAPHRTDVDLHQTLPRVGVNAQRVWEILNGHATTIPAMGANLRVLCRSARLVHLAIHATQWSANPDRPRRDLSAAIGRVTEGEVTEAVGVAKSLKVAATVAWALETSGHADMAARFGPGVLAAVKPGEHGWASFVSSRVHWQQRARYLRIHRRPLTQLYIRSALGSIWRTLRSSRTTR